MCEELKILPNVWLVQLLLFRYLSQTPADLRPAFYGCHRRIEDIFIRSDNRTGRTNDDRVTLSKYK